MSVVGDGRDDVLVDDDDVLFIYLHSRERERERERERALGIRASKYRA